jgi:hypothetical protein
MGRLVLWGRRKVVLQRRFRQRVDVRRMYVLGNIYIYVNDVY